MARYGREVKTLGAAAREFAPKWSPRMLAVAIAAALTVRIAIGDYGWPDAVAAAAMLVVYPFGEWAIHVYLLHLRPFEFRGRRVDLPTARAHREHHEQPNDLTMILLGPTELAELIHTAHRPRSRYSRTIWRNHRLHHFKNERYWHGITQNLSDRVHRTNPDQRTVRRSRTARTLDPGPSR